MRAVTIGGFLILLVVSSPQRPDSVQRTAVPGGPIDEQVKAIKDEIRRVDTVLDAPDAASIHRIAKDLPHWQIEGAFDAASAIFINALHTEGSVVRQEIYYLQDGIPLRVTIEQWWDIEDGTQEPEPLTRQELYIEGERVIRRVIEVASSPPSKRVNDDPASASSLFERVHLLTEVLRGAAETTAALEHLESFPEARLPQDDGRDRVDPTPRRR